jgi:hypothetical protein
MARLICITALILLACGTQATKEVTKLQIGVKVKPSSRKDGLVSLKARTSICFPLDKLLHFQGYFQSL